MSSTFYYSTHKEGNLNLHGGKIAEKANALSNVKDIVIMNLYIYKNLSNHASVTSEACFKALSNSIKSNDRGPALLTSQPATVVQFGKLNSVMHIGLTKRNQAFSSIGQKRYFCTQNSKGQNVLDRFKINHIWPNPSDLNELKHKVEDKQINLC